MSDMASALVLQIWGLMLLAVGAAMLSAPSEMNLFWLGMILAIVPGAINLAIGVVLLRNARRSRLAAASPSRR